MQSGSSNHVDEVTAWAPGRVNLIGEHLDYNGGLCLPIALPLGTTATVRRSADGRHRFRSGDLSWDGDPDDRPDGWAAYVIGVLASLDVSQGLEIRITSDLPIGAGLSSSAALECSVALAVDELLSLDNDRDALRDACIRAENEFVGVPSGGLDQSAALFCEPGAGLLLDFTTGDRSLVPFLPGAAGCGLMVVDTGVRHRLTDGAYGDRAAECRQATDELGLRYLAAITYDDLPRLSSTVLRRRARHVLTEQLRVQAFAVAIATGDWTEAGALMTASHLSLRDDFEVSCVELDVAVQAALSAGALGARMTGGGFGGSMIVLADLELLPAIRARLAAAYAENGWDAPTCHQVEASRSAYLQPTT